MSKQKEQEKQLDTLNLFFDFSDENTEENVKGVEEKIIIKEDKEENIEKPKRKNKVNKVQDKEVEEVEEVNNPVVNKYKLMLKDSIDRQTQDYGEKPTKEQLRYLEAMEWNYKNAHIFLKKCKIKKIRKTKNGKEFINKPSGRDV